MRPVQIDDDHVSEFSLFQGSDSIFESRALAPTVVAILRAAEAGKDSGSPV